jgi:sulfoquinovosidase
MIGLLNGGLSGFSLGHSDIGGYTSINETLFGKNFKIYRTKELLLRWIEMSTYSDVIMRSHPSNKPLLNYQAFSDNETAQFLAFFGQ